MAEFSLNDRGLSEGGEISTVINGEVSSGDIVTVEPGTYTWDEESIEIPDHSAVRSSSNTEHVTLELGTTMQITLEDGAILDGFHVSGSNPEPKAGIDLGEGVDLHRFVWPEGGNQPEDRAIYAPGHSTPAVVTYSLWANMGNNGAYTDNGPVRYTRCAAINNNIAGMRTGAADADDPYADESVVRDCLVACLSEPPTDGGNSSNGRGIRAREPGVLVIDGGWFVYEGDYGNPVEIEDDLKGSDSVVRIRNEPHFVVPEGTTLISDETDGDIEYDIQSAVTVPPGMADKVDPGIDGLEVKEADKAVPTPGAVVELSEVDEHFDLSGSFWKADWSKDNTGYGEGNYGEGEYGDAEPDTGDTEPDYKHSMTVKVHGDNEDETNIGFTVDGDIEYGPNTEPDEDEIFVNEDGTISARSWELDPGSQETYLFNGEVLNYYVSEGKGIFTLDDESPVTVSAVPDDGSDDGGTDTPDDGKNGDTGDSGGSTDGLTEENVRNIVQEELVRHLEANPHVGMGTVEEYVADALSNFETLTPADLEGKTMKITTNRGGFTFKVTIESIK